MKFIELTGGKRAIVDDADYEWLNQWNWWSHNMGYAMRQYRKNHVQVNILMHRLIMDAPNHLQVDHINENKLDNQRKNLRLVTLEENVILASKSRHGHRCICKSFIPSFDILG